MPFRLKRVLASLRNMSSVSSAYCRIGKSPPKLSEMGCVNTPISQTLLTILCKRSVARTKSNGERGSSCLTPILHLKIFPGVPLSRTEDVPEPRMFSIHFIHFDGKPLCFITSRMAWCSTLSKAFSKLSFRMTIFFWNGGRDGETGRPKLGSHTLYFKINAYLVCQEVD